MTKTTKKGLIAICIAILLVAACLAVMPKALAFADEVSTVAVNASFAGGTGTADDPYLIANEEQLYNIRNLRSYDGTTQAYRITQSFKLTKTIVIKNTWTPIAAYFDGTLDGDNYSIDSLQIEVKENVMSYYGLFQYVGKGTVKNLFMTNVSVTYPTGNTDSLVNYVGAIAGLNQGTITNCTVTGSFEAYNLYNVNMGGLAGVNEGTISTCKNMSTVAGCGIIGGIVGLNRNGGLVTSCVNSGTINFKRIDVDRYAGGIVGENTNANVLYCENTGDMNYVGPFTLVAVRPCMGQIVGWRESGTVKYYTCDGKCDFGKLFGNQTNYCSKGAIGKDDLKDS